MTGRPYLAAIAAAAILLVVLSAFGAHGLVTQPQPKVVAIMLASAIPYAAVIWFSLRFDTRQDVATLRTATWMILAGALAARLVLLPWPPDSTDVYRYVWDGRVQAAGINPYRYIPADPALTALRDEAIYPNINRADYAPTIYPPMAQGIFRLVGFAGGGVTSTKLVMVLFEGVTVAAVLALLRRRGLPPTRVMIYAWSPLALYEFAGSGHIDAAAIALMMAALAIAERGRAGIAGVLLAAATVTKFFPIVVAPALYRRWDWRAPAAFVAAVIALYLPFLSVGSQVFGFLTGYAHEEAIDDGTGFFLLGLLDRHIDLPDWARNAYLAATLALLATGTLVTVVRSKPDRVDLRGALFLLTAFTVAMSPHLPWYFSWTLPLLCLVPWWSVLYLTMAAPLLYWQAHHADDPIYTIGLYFPFFLILLGETAIRGLARILERRRHVSLAV